MIYDSILRDAQPTYDAVVWLAAQGLREAAKFPAILKAASLSSATSNAQVRQFVHNLMLRYLQNIKVAGCSPEDDVLATQIVHEALASDSDARFAKLASATVERDLFLWDRLSDENKFFLLSGLPRSVYERVKKGSFSNFVGAVVASAVGKTHIAKVAGARFRAKPVVKPLALEICRLHIGKS